MIDEATYDQLDRYFHSAMNEAERNAFESKMNADKQLREEFAWLNNMLGGMKSQGRSVMKQTIAAAIAGIPSGEVAKYRPSVNGKSFLKRWWVAIAVTVIVLVVAIAAYKYITRHIDPAGYDTEGQSMDVNPTQGSENVDSCADSLVTAMSGPPADAQLADSTKAFSEHVIVNMNGKEAMEVYYDVNDRDSITPIVITGGGYAWTNQQQVPMKTTIIQGPPPYTYELTDKLILKSNYTTTAGFVFTGKGDTFYMTDNSQQHFMLLKGKGELPLTPLHIGANK